MRNIIKVSADFGPLLLFFIIYFNNENDLNTLLRGLKLVGDFMDKTILKPNNMNYPPSRRHLINSLK